MPDSLTDPTGRSFLSYSQERGQEANLLVQVQRELGIPTWRDVDDLEGNMGHELRRTLVEDPEIADALLWLTPEVADSPAIRRLEAPAILERDRRGDAFFVQAVAAGGLGYREAAALAGEHLGVHDLRSWKFITVDEPILTRGGALGVARRVLDQRIDAIHRELLPGFPLKLRLVARGDPPGFRPGFAWDIDWRHHFDARFARPGAWGTALLPALQALRHSARKAPAREIEASGSASLSAGFALGRTFLSVAGRTCTWSQYIHGRPPQFWSLGAEPEESGFVARVEDGVLHGEEVAILVSVAEDAAQAFGRTRESLPPFAAVVEVLPPAAPDGKYRPFQIKRAGQAVDIVAKAVEAIRSARRTYHPKTLHLFLATPLGLAFLLGQSSNTLGPIQLYEHEEIDAVGRYRPELLFAAGDRYASL